MLSIEKRFASSIVAVVSTINFWSSRELPIEVTYAFAPASICVVDEVQVMFSTDPTESSTFNAVVASATPPSQRNGELTTCTPTSPEASSG